LTAEQAFDNYHKAIYRFVYRLAGRGDIAEDITQDCFLAILRDPQRWNEWRGDFRTYLFSIARNLAFKRYRDEHGSLYADEDEASFAGCRQADQELSVTVAQMVSQLPDLQREVLILFEYDGFSLHEIAAIVNADVGAVKGRLHRARERLRRALTPYRRVGTRENA
jgi:RNA polymerase sigma-70 factor (ECF subfamily)